MHAILHALGMAFAMFWEILWALILGFGLSAIVQAVVGKEQMTRLLPDDSPKTLAIACGLGAASSSCSYAAVALARSLFRKGANFTAAMAFQLASTNLVAELGIIMVPLVGPVVAILSFVCSVGNVPLAAVLWNGGSSFGGVIAFIFADLIVIPILNIYRKYYGLKISAFLLGTFFASMSLSALGIEFLFQALHLVPRAHHARIVEASISMNYTTVLNIIFLAVAALLLWRFVTTGGMKMLRMMNRMPVETHAH